MKISRFQPVWPTFLAQHSLTLDQVWHEVRARAGLVRKQQWRRALALTWVAPHSNSSPLTVKVGGVKGEGQKTGGQASDGSESHDTHATALTEAMARRADCLEIKEILDTGCPINDADTDTGWTALHWAAYWARADAVAILVGAGAEVTQKDVRGYAPVFVLRRARQDSDTVACLKQLMGPHLSGKNLEQLESKFGSLEGAHRLFPHAA